MNYCQPRPRHHHRGLPSMLRQSMLGSPLPYSLVSSVAINSALPAYLSRHATHSTPLHHTIQAVQKPAKSRNTHSAEHADRGFGHPRLSGAYRQPKLFRGGDRPLLGMTLQKQTSADVVFGAANRLTDSGVTTSSSDFQADVRAATSSMWREATSGPQEDAPRPPRLCAKSLCKKLSPRGFDSFSWQA